MADLRRKGSAIWNGNLRNGNGTISSESGALQNAKYSYGTRWEQSPGTNPEELIAAAHAGCFSQALAHTLTEEGYSPQRIETSSTITFSVDRGGSRITKSHIELEAQVPDITPETFQEIVRKADQGCPVSNLLRNGLEIQVSAKLK